MRRTKEPRSNTWILLVPFVAWFAGAFAYVRLFQEDTHGRYDPLMAAGLSIPFFATAVAQLRSGYLWCNLAPGNRGKHRSGCLGKFIVFTVAHVLVGTGIAIFFIHQFLRGEGGAAPDFPLSPGLESPSSGFGPEH